MEPFPATNINNANNINQYSQKIKSDVLDNKPLTKSKNVDELVNISKT